MTDGPKWSDLNIAQCLAGAPSDANTRTDANDVSTTVNLGGAHSVANTASSVPDPAQSLSPDLWDLFEEFDEWLIREREILDTYTV